MTEVRVRGVDDDVVRQLRLQAKRHGRTLQDEIKELLSEAVGQPYRLVAAELTAFQEELRSKYGEMSDSTPLIREERDRWS